jgi:hypothetical protein
MQAVRSAARRSTIRRISRAGRRAARAPSVTRLRAWGGVGSLPNRACLPGDYRVGHRGATRTRAGCPAGSSRQPGGQRTAQRLHRISPAVTQRLLSFSADSWGGSSRCCGSGTRHQGATDRSAGQILAEPAGPPARRAALPMPQRGRRSPRHHSISNNASRLNRKRWPECQPGQEGRTMGPANVLVDADWVQAQLNDPGAALAEVSADNPKRTRRHLRCSCHHRLDAHRHYRPGSDCAVCKCPRWSPRNPLLRLAGRNQRRGR